MNRSQAPAPCNELPDLPYYAVWKCACSTGDGDGADIRHPAFHNG
ncbi:hypothetical protein O9992_12680 [Vibrio lentus]|nr:hypothetical protein [Vibrio lentus]